MRLEEQEWMGKKSGTDNLGHRASKPRGVKKKGGPNDLLIPPAGKGQFSKARDDGEKPKGVWLQTRRNRLKMFKNRPKLKQTRGQGGRVDVDPGHGSQGKQA